MLHVVGVALLTLGLGHIATGVVWFRRPLLAIWRDGVFKAVAAAPERRLAFWFMLFTPVLLIAGQVVLHAAATGDGYLVRVIGWHLLGVAVAGIVGVNKPPFWIAALLAAILLRSGYAA